VGDISLLVDGSKKLLAEFMLAEKRFLVRNNILGQHPCA